MTKSKEINFKLIFCVIILCCFGLVMQYSASRYNAFKETGDSLFYVKKQLIAFAVGIVALVSATKVNTEFYKKIKWYLLVVSIILLAIIFIPVLGVEKYGARRWLNLGLFTIQPSEFSKFGLIFFLAGYIHDHKLDKVRNLIIPLITTAIICVLIMLEPNMSITMLVGLSVLIMLVCGGIKARYIFALAVPVMILVAVLIFAEPYRVKRILAFINPWENSQDEGFQLIQSFYALSGGGVFGVGLFNSRQKYTFLPFAESDFIFSIIGEELGFVGSVLLIMLFIYVVFLGVKVAMSAKNVYSSLLAVGITSIIACQTLLNVAVVTGSIPPTGLPLPFISNGGSSLVVFLYAVGVLVRIGKESNDTHLLYTRHKMK